MRRLAARTAVAAFGLAPGVAQAGWYVSPAAKWAAYSLRPEAAEATPNYYSIGGSLSAGYSLRQVVDLGVFSQYLPGTLKRAQIGKADATLVSYGGELGVRLAESVYLGVHGGAGLYSLERQPGPAEVGGHWTGSCGGVALGAISKLSKTGFIQTTFDLTQYLLSARSGAGPKRAIDQFSVGVAYLYNSVGGGTGGLDSKIFKDFLDSIAF